MSAQLRSGGIFDFDVKKEQLDEIQRELEQPNVWNNPERAQKLGQDRARLEEIVGTLQRMSKGLVDARELLGDLFRQPARRITERKPVEDPERGILVALLAESEEGVERETGSLP